MCTLCECECACCVLCAGGGEGGGLEYTYFIFSGTRFCSLTCVTVVFFPCVRSFDLPPPLILLPPPPPHGLVFAFSQVLVDLLNSNFLDGKKEAIGVLWNLAMNADNVLAIRKAGAIPILMEFLQHDDSPLYIVQVSIGVLQRLAMERGGMAAIRKAGGVRRPQPTHL